MRRGKSWGCSMAKVAQTKPSATERALTAAISATQKRLEKLTERMKNDYSMSLFDKKLELRSELSELQAALRVSQTESFALDVAIIAFWNSRSELELRVGPIGSSESPSTQEEVE